MPCTSPLELPLLAQPVVPCWWVQQHECCGVGQSCTPPWQLALQGGQALWPAAGGAGVVTGAAAGTVVAVLACACREAWWGAAAAGGWGAWRWQSFSGCYTGHWQGALGAAAGAVAGMLACACGIGGEGVG